MATLAPKGRASSLGGLVAYEDSKEAAQLYATFGWRVVPLAPGKKVPSMKDWPNVATCDPAVIESWEWTGGVAIVTGPESGVWVLDVDVKNDAGGAETLRRLHAEHGNFTATYVATTPSGGLHFFWKYPSNRTIRNSASGRLGPGLDVRGVGGQVNAYPTARTEGSYRWVHGRAM